ncbi:Cytochrome c oxidase assembly protein cox11, mitochondrial [Asimina triloba]
MLGLGEGPVFQSFAVYPILCNSSINLSVIAYREIVVQFNADIADGMPWKFVPAQREVRVKPGESALAFYTAGNRSSTPITGMSPYNVTPMKVLFSLSSELLLEAAVYLNKMQCFCFEEQRLLPSEQIDMPLPIYNLGHSRLTDRSIFSSTMKKQS